MSFKTKGFTLIEILVVISIVGLLSSVFLVGLSGFRSRGRDARRLADLKSVQQGLEIYYTRCNFYPGTTNCAAGTNPTSWADTGESVTNVLTGTSNLGITKVPNDPLAGNDYLYGVTTGGQGYVIGAKLENPGDTALNTDVDGTVNGVDCTGGTTDTVYCVQF